MTAGYATVRKQPVEGNMVKLFCAIVGGQGSAFPVEIDASESVGDLKEAIKKKKENDLKAIDPDKLELFLAKKGDAWLDRDGAEAVTLDGHGYPVGFTHMDPLLWIKNPKNFGVNFEPNEGEIHVLVVVPPENEGSATCLRSVEAFGDVAEERFNKVLNERDEKMSAYSMSDLNTENQERIIKKMRLTESVPDVKEPADTSIPAYSWIPKVAENEESQRSGYMAYLRQHLKTLIDRGDFLLDDIAGDKSILSVVDPRLPFAMKGTADVLLINRTAKNPLIKLAGVSMVIELKKKVEPAHVPQAIGQLVSCSIKAPLNCYPLSLLTDLNDHWHFSWFSDKHVLTQVTLQYPKNAFNFIEAAVLKRMESPPLPPSFIPGPFKTIKVDDFLPQPVDAHAEEMMERYELMADVVEPEFLMARRMEYAQHLVQSMPMYAHMYA